MTNPGTSYTLPLNAGEADHLVRLVSIGQLAVAEYDRSGRAPLSRPVDAAHMLDHLKALKLAPSIDPPMQALAAWAQAQRKG